MDMSETRHQCARSSVGQSRWLLSTRSEVRILPGVPTNKGDKHMKNEDWKGEEIAWLFQQGHTMDWLAEQTGHTHEVVEDFIRIAMGGGDPYPVPDFQTIMDSQLREAKP